MPLMLPAVAILFLLAAPTPALEQDVPPQPGAGQAAPKKKKKKTGGTKKKDDAVPQFRLDDHPSVHFGKGTHLDFRARFAADHTTSEAADAADTESSAIDLGKKRLGVSGEIRNAVEFQVEAELTGTDPWRDVYADYKQFDAARVRGGRFKLPFSLDENTSPTHLDFMFRSLAATHLAPGRDNGVMAHGRVVDKVLGYEIGVFEHDGKNARTSNTLKVYGGRTLAGRVTVEPLRNVKDAVGDVSLGAAFTTSDVPEGIAGLRGLTVLDQKFFSSSDYWVSGKRRRTGIEMQFRPGPASVKAEWMRVQTERRGESVENTDLSPLVGQGWYVSGTYAITGEKKSRVDRPKKPLLQGGAGAIEVAARVESLEFKSGSTGETPSRSPRAEVVVGNRDRAATFGVNWYVNRFIKIQANVIRENLDDPLQGPLPSKTSFTTKAIRFQFSL